MCESLAFPSRLFHSNCWLICVIQQSSNWVVIKLTTRNLHFNYSSSLIVRINLSLFVWIRITIQSFEWLFIYLANDELIGVSDAMHWCVFVLNLLPENGQRLSFTLSSGWHGPVQIKWQDFLCRPCPQFIVSSYKLTVFIRSIFWWNIHCLKLDDSDNRLES